MDKTKIKGVISALRDVHGISKNIRDVENLLEGIRQEMARQYDTLEDALTEKPTKKPRRAR